MTLENVTLPEADLRAGPVTIMDATGRVVEVVAALVFTQRARRCAKHDGRNCSLCRAAVPKTLGAWRQRREKSAVNDEETD